jgi:hypothetical protein
VALGPRSWLALGLAAALLVAVAPARATAAWQAPFAVSPPGQEAGEPDLAFDRQGNALVVWRQAAPVRGIHAATFSAGTGLAVPQTISGVGGAPQVGFDARGEAIAVWHRRSGGPDGCSLCVEAAFRPPAGVFALPQRLPLVGADPQLAVDPRGSTLVLARDPGGIAKPIRASFRSAGGAFGAEQKLGGGQTGDPQVAFDARGRAVAVWSRGVRVLSAFRPRRGPFGKPQVIAGGDLPSLSVDRRGNALAVWRRGVFPRARVLAAFRPADGRFGRVQRLSGPDSGDEADVAFDRRGNALAVWWRRGRKGGSYRVQVAFRPAGARFRRPRTISRPAGRVAEPRVAFDRRGNGLVAWAVELGRERGARVQAALRPAGRHFGKPRTIARAEGVGSLQIAFAPAGEALAVWEELELGDELFPAGSRIRAAAFRR